MFDLDFITLKLFLKDRITAQKYYEISINYEEVIQCLVEEWDEVYEFIQSCSNPTFEQQQRVDNVTHKCIYYACAMKHNLSIYPNLIEMEDSETKLKIAKKMHKDKCEIASIKSNINMNKDIAKETLKLSLKMYKLILKMFEQNKKFEQNKMYPSDEQEFFDSTFFLD